MYVAKRNDSCPCGSGKKYKKCCLRSVPSELEAAKADHEQAIQLAVQHHQAGRLPEAEAIYRQVLIDQPQHADALHLSGMAAYQSGRHEEAIALIRQAIASAPSTVLFHANLGAIYHGLKRWAEAAACYRQVLTLDSNQTEARVRLHDVYRDMGLAQFEAGDYVSALQNYRASMNEGDAGCAVLVQAMGAKAWCGKTGAPYIICHDAHDIEIEAPRFIGARFDAVGGVTRSNELYVAELHGAKVFAHCNIVMLDAETAVYDNIVHSLGETLDLRFEQLIKSRRQDRLLIDFSGYQNETAECGIHLSGSSSRVYGHWMYEYLPKLKLLEALPQYDDFPLYVDEAMPPSHYQALEMLNRGRREIRILRTCSAVVFDRLLVAPQFTFFPFACKPGVPASIHIAPTSLEAVQFLRERMLSSLGLNAEPRPDGIRGRRIYLGRTGGRNLVNSQEIESELERYGFEVVYPERLSFAQQVTLFNETECVFGPNGSAFINAIFCKQGAKIASFVQSYPANFASWAQVMEQMGYRHLYVAGNAVQGTSWHEHHYDYEVPLILIQQALEIHGLT